MACGRRRLRPVRIPVPPHPHDEPQARDAERAARRFTRPAGGAAARAVPPRGVPGDAPRAARPWRDAAPAWGVPRPARGGGASRAPLCLEGHSRRPPTQRGSASEVGAQLRRRGVEADDVEQPRVGRVGDREAVRDRATATSGASLSEARQRWSARRGWMSPAPVSESTWTKHVFPLGYFRNVVRTAGGSSERPLP
jgi:hypothetical protein